MIFGIALDSITTLLGTSLEFQSHLPPVVEMMSATLQSLVAHLVMSFRNPRR